MALKSIVRDGIRSLSRRRFDFCSSATDFRFDSVETLPSGDGYDGEESHWAEFPPELLWNVVKRLEASESAWQGRRNVVACAAVCRAWRRVCKEVVGVPEISAKLTFAASLKQVCGGWFFWILGVFCNLIGKFCLVDMLEVFWFV